MLADFLAAAMDPSCAGGDHAAIYVERAAIRWLMELIGFPTDGIIGLLTSGGSEANLLGLAAARQRAADRDGWSVRREGLQRSRPPLVLYASEQGHSCIQKAAELMGLGAEAVRGVPVDARFRMEVKTQAKSKIVGDLYWSVNFAESYTSQPPSGKPRNDLSISATLGWTF